MNDPYRYDPAAIDLDSLRTIASRVRATCFQMSHDSREGHLKSALSCTDLLVALFHGFLHLSPDDPKAPDRDRFYFSKGHACMALYATMASRGFLPSQLLGTYAQSGSPLQDHPCKHLLPLLEMSSGSLGHGLGIATGALYGLRLDGNPARAIVLMSDGECNEGSVWESAMFAAAHKLDRLLAIVDYNGIQAVGRSDELMGHTSLEGKFRAFGFAARTIAGNDLESIVRALAEFPFEPGRPSAIIARTTSGAGVRFAEDQVLWHYRVPNDEELARALAELGENPLHHAPVRS